MAINTIYNKFFLKDHINSIIKFYHPICIDSERGGYINQLNDDGEIYDRDTKHLVGTCRFIFNYAISALLFKEKEYIEKWLSRNNTSPISRRPLYIRDLRPNIALKNLISNFNDKIKKQKL